MSFDEKRAWMLGVVSVLAYVTYAAVVLARSGPVPVSQVPYAGALLTSVGAAIAVSIVLQVAVAARTPEGARSSDQRDREIGRFGEHIGQSLVVVGGVAAMLLALAEAAHFWIANALYLAFVLSAVLGSTAKIFAYRRGFHPW
ncbi:hypothetical protein [Jidongwangia harbinensis]|uniref:hypothetical protein n=1 Tax=Jidongwangia harbinensis TaxID=2878561 RepID=UPI001CD9FA63|nr:hypothetical protein [Jidongwangia harbinensis]MCA2216455.1 hypothetical protein [Jidongwangia harbinensis]